VPTLYLLVGGKTEAAFKTFPSPTDGKSVFIGAGVNDAILQTIAFDTTHKIETSAVDTTICCGVKVKIHHKMLILVRNH
jgi:hypothetical protein